MIAAGTISEGAKELLQAERIGYLDRAGSLFLPNDDLYILIDRPAPKEARKMDGPCSPETDRPSSTGCC